MKPKKRKLNVRLLRKIQKYITDEPRRFLMNAWGFKVKDADEWSKKTYLFYDASSEMPPCRTAACIAGTANLLTGGRRLDAATRAAKILGVKTPQQYARQGVDHPLFILSAWPEPYRLRYRNAYGVTQRAKIACQRIDYLIRTGL